MLGNEENIFVLHTSKGKNSLYYNLVRLIFYIRRRNDENESLSVHDTSVDECNRTRIYCSATQAQLAAFH